ncbi:hypothetical protein [Kosakonia oryziphila]|jgi:hypothetical protein|uniref:hypothetical protein n=1 Tax=Kosakonia oryziphila TaxID=1005667 RepID=UPI0014288FB1|nr:hypothetical protein [Kosakonia oryziphila]
MIKKTVFTLIAAMLVIAPLVVKLAQDKINYHLNASPSQDMLLMTRTGKSI